MSAARRVLALGCVIALSSCAKETSTRTDAVDPQAGARIDSMNAKLSTVYRARDWRGYAQLFTDSAVFEWPATVEEWEKG